jgi:hypothetical protein
MAGSYQYLRGAFISFTPQFLVQVPNVIIFQYNPEKMTHTWTESKTEVVGNNRGLSVPGDPEESFSFALLLDSLDVIADRQRTAPIAQTSGVYTRLAALEKLQFPFDKECTVPLVLFTWGPGRIVPVRIARLTITESLYDKFLSPVQAEVELELRVLTDKEIGSLSKPSQRIAKAAAGYETRLRQGLALANLANAADGPIGMLPI